MKAATAADLNAEPLSVTKMIFRISPVFGSARSTINGTARTRSASAIAIWTASIASCRLQVVARCQPNSYLAK